MGVSRKTVRLGVFIPTECQLLDAACVDILASMSHEYLSLLTDIVPKALIDSAPSVSIHYIGTVKPGEPIPMTANQKVVATNYFSDDEVAPGKMDIIIVPGPDPSTTFDKPSLEWLRQQAECPTSMYAPSFHGFRAGPSACRAPLASYLDGCLRGKKETCFAVGVLSDNLLTQILG